MNAHQSATQFTAPNSEAISTIVYLLGQLPDSIVQYLAPHRHTTQPIPDPNKLHKTTLKLVHTATIQHPRTVSSIKPMPGQKATLRINNIEVSANYHASLRHAALTPDLHEYFLNKYPNWTDATIASIDWNVHNKAMQRLTSHQQKTIRQFIHEWLPVNAHKGSTQAISTLCPLCHSMDETQAHFLTCMDKRSIAGWKKTVDEVQTKAAKLHLHPMMSRLLCNAITHWRHSPNPNVPEFLPDKYHALFHHQAAIGWDQLLKGRMSTLWASLHNELSNETKGCSKLTNLLTTIMHQVYNVWKIRCDIQHGTTDKCIRDKLLYQLGPRVQAIYSARPRLNYIDRNQLSAPIEQTLALPIKQLEHWVHRNTKNIKEGIKRAIAQDRLHMHPIQRFFSAQPKTNQHQRPPTLTPPTTPTIPSPVTFQRHTTPSNYLGPTTTPNHQIIHIHPSTYRPP
jgi:hypothetical protein